MAREALADYRRRGGYDEASWATAPNRLIDLVDASGLRGRGGSSQPAGWKWRAVAGEPGPRVVLVNGAETEPASAKDRLLLASRPHLVLEGALLAARAVGADTIVFYLAERAPEARRSVEEALRELLGDGRRLPVWRIVEAPDAYVAGEQTAAIRRANGKAAKPTFRELEPYQRGVGDRPTLVQNVETLANVPGIVRDGPDAFRAAGTPELPGTLLVTLSGDVNRPGVYEVPGGAPIRRLLGEMGGGIAGNRAVQAVLPGGYYAGWIGPDDVEDGAALTRESLQRYGATLGAGAITVVSDAVCGLWQAVALLRFSAEQSARQCGPCTFGTQAMADALERLALGAAGPDDLARLRRFAEVVLPKRGACGHLDGATIAARTALRVFDDEIRRHARDGTCGRPRRIVLPGLEARHADLAA